MNAYISSNSLDENAAALKRHYDGSYFPIWQLWCGNKKKSAALAPPEVSYELLPELSATQREGLSHISRFLPAVSAVSLPPQRTRAGRDDDDGRLVMFKPRTHSKQLPA